jgi:leader peptidase (prepilin peptidase) / N-methyltransferase
VEFELIVSGIVGLVLGSFLNAAIYRVPRDISLVDPLRSICPQCKIQLKWYDNIPVVSWLLLGGKCRGCRKPISGQYPLVELLAGFGACATYLKFGLTPTGFLIFALVLALIVITFIDLEFRIIPDVISIPGIIISLGAGVTAQFSPLLYCRAADSCVITQGVFDSLIGMAAGGGFFLIVGAVYLRLAKQEGVGLGDVKLLGMTGALLGWRSVIPTIFMGSVIGAVVGIAVMVMQKTGRKTEIAFGPWLSLGALIYIFADLPFFRF